MPRYFRSLLIQMLAAWKGLAQKEIAARAGIDAKQVSRLLTRETLEDGWYRRLLKGVRGRPAEVAVVTGCLEALDALRQDRGLTEAEQDEIEAGVLEGQRVLREALSEAARRSRAAPRLDGYPRPDEVEPARWHARHLWPGLKALPEAQQLAVVRVSRSFQSWALMELVCEESVTETSRDLDSAARLARLAVAIAETVRGPEAWCNRVKGYARAHPANIERVFGRLEAADAGLEEANQLWLAGADPDNVLDPGRLFDLEASLRRDQRRFAESLARLADAKAVGRRPERYLINKGFTLEVMGDYEQAIAVLLEARRQVERGGDPRLLYMLLFNLSVNYTHTARFAEAAALARRVRAAASARGDKSETSRVTWLEGRIAAGLGRRLEALALLEKARAEFEEREMWYDVALALLEMAALLLDEGKVKEVKALTSGLVRAFESDKVHPEAQAALQLFQRAAAQEAVTAAAARRLLGYLFLARYNQGLRYES